MSSRVYVHERASTNGAPRGGTALMSSKPTLITYPAEATSTQPQLRFLIMDAPRQQNLHLYIKECKRHGVTDIVRVCESTYTGTSELATAGIELHEMAYDDGTSPPDDVINRWLDIVYSRFFENEGKKNGTIAVHCIAGLGRAPVLVAIALIEFANCDAVNAVAFIRKLRRGAINGKQLTYLEQYKVRRGRSGGGGACCVVM
eukprot:CAMPEP_0196820494 /NCGR_PEP_ID=MMETSP1362-20130617/75549_1 /TAXON_ID=163516 /ORGANISM="Leptocylindrus danicus, Strain CCMP1856" /LENGTH=201 /DNA_ID=CAMNT_0042199403 /DNA_START=224 /DNA_END=829 /DNA_ORIENTATION=-